MSDASQVYSGNFAYRPPVEPIQDVVPVALVYGSVAPPPGRIMSSLAGAGGLAGPGGIAGPGGGLAGG